MTNAYTSEDLRRDLRAAKLTQRDLAEIATKASGRRVLPSVVNKWCQGGSPVPQFVAAFARLAKGCREREMSGVDLRIMMGIALARDEAKEAAE